MQAEFKKSAKRAARYRDNLRLIRAQKQFMKESMRAKYSYNFSWMGRMLIQYPEDIVVMQEIIWSTEPDLIIETGTAHGGSAIFFASLLKLLGHGKVVSIDINVYPENKMALREHPLSQLITLIDGSSTDPRVVARIKKIAQGKKKIMVVLDSLHSHEHVLKELEVYSPFVNKGGYMIVCDTFVEDMPPHSYPDRPWDKGSNPKTAAREFLKKNRNFIIDHTLQNKLLITGSPDGYLKRIK